jgi:hypothetical protein
MATDPKEAPMRASPNKQPEPGKVELTDQEKVTLWQQRFFEAQASCEEYLMDQGGWEAIDRWIEANSSITARKFSLHEPAPEKRAAYSVARFVNQLRCYDSDISYKKDEEKNSYTVTNRDCGILRYRKIAASGGVRLTFATPCDYCIKLNSKIIQKYVEGASVEVVRTNGGCRWQVILPPDGAGSDYQSGAL